MQQKLIGRNLLIQMVSYNCSSTVAITGMETLADISAGRIHCYNALDPVSKTPLIPTN